MNWIKRFIKAWQETADSYTYQEKADEEIGWTNEDAIAAVDFMSSEAGKKLKIRLTNFVCRSAIEATRQPFNPQYHMGVARGIGMAVRAMQDHFFAGQPRSAGKPEAPPAGLEEALALM